MNVTTKDWYGLVPDRWELLPARTLFGERVERGRSDLRMLSVTISRGVIPQNAYLEFERSKKDQARFDQSQYKVVHPGDIVYNKMRAWQGASGRSSELGIVSPAYVVLRPFDGVSSRYFHYAFRTPSFSREAERHSFGINSDMWSLRPKHFKSITFPVPPMGEQELIVRYLDHAELRIAKAIAAKLELVRLLVEQRKVIESELIFGGGWKPNSDRWFGDLPKLWKVEAARALFSERVERGRSDLEMLSVTISRGVVQQSEYLKSAGSKKDQARQDRSQYKVVEIGDIVYNKMRAWQGAAGASRYQGIVSPAYVVVSPRDGINSDYYGLVVRTPQFAREAERNSYGIVSDMWSLRPQHFKMIEFPNPPLAEQLEIVERCEATTRNLVGAIDSVEREAALLKEYRTRLISDVVTGKLDVRAEAAKLPAIDPDELVEVSAGAGLMAEDDGDDE